VLRCGAQSECWLQPFPAYHMQPCALLCESVLPGPEQGSKMARHVTWLAIVGTSPKRMRGPVTLLVTVLLKKLLVPLPSSHGRYHQPRQERVSAKRACAVLKTHMGWVGPLLFTKM
jgi:hypothetical protein